jgi:branched-chain amino acid transport system ATP-binding protein
MTAELRVAGLRSGYGDLTVLWEADLAVHSGKITAVLGRNGAGKTTMLHTIAGLLPAKLGTVTLDGRDITRQPCHQRIKMGLSLVQEGRRIFLRKSVEENLLLGAYTRRLRHRAKTEALAEAYERFPVLAERRRSPASNLSGGQQEMLAIAQALIAAPRILMLDEPSAGLAPRIVENIFETMRGLADDGLGVLLVDQRVEDARAIADHVLVMELGRMLPDPKTLNAATA